MADADIEISWEAAMMFPKPRPRIFEKRDLQRERKRVRDAVRAAIKARDGYACRCCGRTDHVRQDPHHLRFSSLGGPDTTENEILTCGFCHAAIHARQIYVLGSNADKLIMFDIHESVVQDIFGTRVLPTHCRIITDRRR
jgi:hypothetical protein